MLPPKCISPGLRFVIKTKRTKKKNCQELFFVNIQTNHIVVDYYNTAVVHVNLRFGSLGKFY